MRIGMTGAAMAGGGGEYTAIKCISSNGHQYINTLVNFNTNIRICLSFYLPQFEDKNMLGIENGNIFRICSGYYGPKSTWALMYINVMSLANSGAVGNNTIDFSKDGFVLNGNTYSVYQTSYSTSNPILLFTASTNLQSSDNFSTMSVQSCSIFESGQQIRDYVPVIRNADSKPGLLDRISGVFFVNSGTGDFGYEKEDSTIINPT